MSKKEIIPERKVIKKHDIFRITTDFSTPFVGEVEPCDWYYLEHGVINASKTKFLKTKTIWGYDWYCMKCSTDYHEIEHIYEELIK